MTDIHCKEAYNGKPIPDDLPKEEHPHYIMLSILYGLFKDKHIDGDTAKEFKKRIMEFENNKIIDNVSLLQYFIMNELDKITTKDNKESIAFIHELLYKYFKICFEYNR